MREGKRRARSPCIWLERQLYVRGAEVNETDRTREGGQGEGSQPTLRFPSNSHHTCVSEHLRSTEHKNRTELPEDDGGDTLSTPRLPRIHSPAREQAPSGALGEGAPGTHLGRPG